MASGYTFRGYLSQINPPPIQSDTMASETPSISSMLQQYAGKTPPSKDAVDKKTSKPTQVPTTQVRDDPPPTEAINNAPVGLKKLQWLNWQAMRPQ